MTGACLTFCSSLPRRLDAKLATMVTIEQGYEKRASKAEILH